MVQLFSMLVLLFEKNDNDLRQINKTGGKRVSHRCSTIAFKIKIN